MRRIWAYATHLDYLRQLYGHLVQIVPVDVESAERGKQEHKQYAEHRSRQARLNARIASIPIPAGTIGVSLYQAIEAYAERVEQASGKEGAKVEAANARRLKDATADMDLGEFGYSALERIRDYWAARPEAKLRAGKTTGRPISLTTVDNHLSTARRLVRWLDRSDHHDWELPRHGLDALKINLKGLRTREEVAQLRHGVKVFTVEQLATIYRHATDYERLLVLLGLNAAMAQAEVITLRWEELEDNPPTIKRVRHKSGVYGEFALWPETQQALDWWRRLRPATTGLVMVSGGGLAYTRQRIANSWVQLRRRIERAGEGRCDWWLPFKHLRKSSAEMVRQVADGEIAGVLLSHGQPVQGDHLSDAYSNRPFEKVAEALGRVREELKPLFAAAPAAFSKMEIGRGASKRKGIERE